MSENKLTQVEDQIAIPRNIERGDADTVAVQRGHVGSRIETHQLGIIFS